MGSLNPAKTIEKMIAAGIQRETLDTLEYAGIDIKRWLCGFDSVHDSVRNSVAVIRKHPLVPARVPIHGLVIDPTTGELEVVSRGDDVQGVKPVLT